MIVAVDTNVLVYAEGVNDAGRAQTAQALLRRLPTDDAVVPAQVLAELFHVLTRKARYPAERATGIVQAWQATPNVVATSREIVVAAVVLATDYRLEIFDAIILAASASAKADMLLSEDMQDGFAWRGVTVVNPFAASPHPLLSALLA